MQLNHIPSYRRYYAWNSEANTWSKKTWEFTRSGFWGINLLDDMKLLDEYLGIEYEEEEDEE
jgi:hypothetical protein